AFCTGAGQFLPSIEASRSTIVEKAADPIAIDNDRAGSNTPVPLPYVLHVRESRRIRSPCLHRTHPTATPSECAHRSKRCRSQADDWLGVLPSQSYPEQDSPKCSYCRGAMQIARIKPDSGQCAMHDISSTRALSPGAVGRNKGSKPAYASTCI